MADYAIHEETLYDIADVIRKKDGTSALIDPADYAGRINLMGMLEEKTVSGSIVTFDDGADAVKLKSCAVTIAPTLDGVSSVDVVQTGKNVIDWASNLTTGTSVGMTFSATADGGISYSGTATGTFGYATAEFDFAIKSGQTFTFSRNADFNYIHRIRLVFSDNTTANVSIYPNNTSVTYTPEKDVKAVRLLLAGLTANTYYNDTVYIQTEYGSTATAYTPYVQPTTHTATLGRTIYGGEVDVVNGTGTETNELVPFSDCTWAVVTSYQSNFNADNGIISLRFGKNAMSTAGYAQTINGVACNVFVNNGRTVWNNANRLNEIGYSDGISVNLHYSDIGLSEWTSNSSNTLTAWRSCQLYQTGVFALVKATPETFTFTAVPIISRLGDNTMWGDGDLSVTYRSSGTQTLIQPTLISKTITENGTYTASDEGADGYDTVTVNVSGGAQNIETVLSENPLLEVTGVSGTDVARTMWTYTAAADAQIVFHASTTVRTNTGSNDGYFTVKKNGVVVATTYADTNTTTALTVPDIDVETGDIVTIECGFDNYHTSAWFRLYSTITILS